MVQFRLPKVNNDDAIWGDILRQYLMKEHYNDDTDNPTDNGGHQNVTIRPGTAAAGTAPLKFKTGTNLTAAEAGAMEYASNTLYFSPNSTTPVRKQVVLEDTNTAASGDILYRDSSGNFAKIGIGSTNDVLTVASGHPAWTSTPTLASPTLTTPVINGTPTGTGVDNGAAASTTGANTPVASSKLALRDTFGNLNSNNVNSGLSSYANAGGTTVLTAGSNYFQYVTGAATSNQNVKLPNTSTLNLGVTFMIANVSAGSVTVQASDSSVIFVLGSFDYGTFTCISTAGTTSAAWFYNQFNVGAASSKDVFFNNTVSFSNPDGNDYTFPAPFTGSSDTVVTQTATQTLTHKTLTSPRIGSDIYDVNGVTVLGLGATVGAANWLYIVNSVSGAAPYVAAAGTTDANVDVGFGPKGTGGIYYFQPTGSTAKYTVDGSATDIDLNLIPKNAGKLLTKGVEVATISGAQLLTNKTVTNKSSAKTANFTIPNADTNQVYFADATSGAVTITLPSASANPGYQFSVKRIDGSGNQVMVASTGGTIDGAASWTLDRLYTSITVVSDNTNWYII